MQVAQIFYYPVKSGAGIEIAAARALSTGLEGDRQFVVVNQDGLFVTQRVEPRLALLRIIVQEKHQNSGEIYQELSLECGRAGDPRHQQLSVNLPNRQAARTMMVQVWNDRVLAMDCGDKAADFLEACFGRKLRLCAALPEEPRWVSSKYTGEERVAYHFADGFPLLVVAQESLDELNSRLVAQNLPPVPMDRFRPNLVVRGWHPHGEDQTKTLKIGSVVIRLAKACTRCSVITVDQALGTASQEPLKTLATYRKGDGGKILFGQNAYVVSGAGQWIGRGDPVEILD